MSPRSQRARSCVVRLDLAGHGGSGNDRKTWSLDGFDGDIRAVVNAAGVDRFTLVGHSVSGTVALATARVLGDRVTGVVPVDSVLDVDAHLPGQTRAAVVGQIRNNYREFIEEQLPILMPKHPEPEVFERVRADAMAKDPDRAATILESVFATAKTSRWTTSRCRLSTPTAAPSRSTTTARTHRSSTRASSQAPGTGSCSTNQSSSRAPCAKSSSRSSPEERSVVPAERALIPLTPCVAWLCAVPLIRHRSATIRIGAGFQASSSPSWPVSPFPQQ
jgi:pimeloyl-ACP methyl ester carboxylesterase